MSASNVGGETAAVPTGADRPVVAILEVGDLDDRPVVAILEVTDLDPQPAVDLLERAGFDVIVFADGIPAGELPPRASQAVAGVVGFAAVGAAEMDRFPDLRLLVTTSTGTDMVDAPAAAARGIDVVGLVGASTTEVATHALTLMLAVLREVDAGRAVVAAGGWTDDLAVTPPDIGALTLGLVGFGRIARETARISRPLFGRILATDPMPVAAEHGAELVGLDELLATADVVSLHLPSTPESRGLLTAERLATMKPGALLVNVSRGDLVDDAAVIAALDAGRLGFYAADVLPTEPPSGGEALRSHPRALITPHMAFLSTASIVRYQLGPAQTIVDRLGTR